MAPHKTTTQYTLSGAVLSPVTSIFTSSKHVTLLIPKHNWFIAAVWVCVSSVREREREKAVFQYVCVCCTDLPKILLKCREQVCVRGVPVENPRCHKLKSKEIYLNDFLFFLFLGESKI